MVKPGGRIGMVEFGVPDNPVLCGGCGASTPASACRSWAAWSRTAWYEVGRFLGPNIEQFHAAHPDLVQLWRAAGIAGVTQRGR